MTRQWHTQMTIWCGAVMLLGLVMARYRADEANRVAAA